MKLFFAIVLGVILNSTLAYSQKKLVPMDFKTPLKLVTRTGAVACKAQFKSENNEKICISEEIWKEWLNSNSVLPYSVKANGRWRQTAFLKNDSSSNPKKIESRFNVEEVLFKDVDSEVGFFRRSLLIIEKKREKVSQSIPKGDWILASLLVGENRNSPVAGIWRDSGFVHIMTATGIHIYALLSILGWILVRIFSRLKLSIQAVLVIRNTLLFLTLFYLWVLSGGRAGFLRPFFVFGLRFLCQRLGIKVRSYTPLILSIGLDLMIWVVHALLFDNPSFGMGRLHYALAVGGGLSGYILFEKTNKPYGHFKQHLAMAFGSYLLPAILDLIHNGYTAPLTPIWSLITVPVFTIFVLPISLFAMAFGLEAQIIPNLSYLLETIMSVFGFVSNYFPLVLISSWALIIGAIIPFFIPNPKIKLFIIGNLLIFRSLIGFIFTPENSKHASHVEMLDVGQGDSLLIQKDNNMAGLFDAGSAHGLSVAAWLRILLNRGITRIDFLGLSHLDEDHSSGVLNLEKIMDIKCIQLAKENYDTEKGVKYLSRLSPELRERVVSKGCFPFSWATDVRSLKGANGIMSGTYITLPNSISFLSMGDADKRAEIKLFNALNTDSTVQYEKAKTRILKISHHGSSTSTNPLLLKLYQPNVTWISSGLGNRFGHPREEVMNWIKALRIRNFRTDIDGFQSIGSLNNY